MMPECLNCKSLAFHLLIENKRKYVYYLSTNDVHFQTYYLE